MKHFIPMFSEDLRSARTPPWEDSLRMMEIKEATRYLRSLYRGGLIDEAAFEAIARYMLFFYFEHAVVEKLSSLSNVLNKKALLFAHHDVIDT